jgi:hypothetical protein
LNGGDDLIDDFGSARFGEVRDAFDELGSHLVGSPLVVRFEGCDEHIIRFFLFFMDNPRLSPK